MIKFQLIKHLLFIAVILLGATFNSTGQKITGKISDSTGKALPFATIKFGNTRQGIIADLDGRFQFNYKPFISSLEISYLNYKTKNINFIKTDTLLNISLEALPANFTIILPAGISTKIKRILNTAIQNRHKHNPDNYNWYQCNVYYKMVADFSIPDSIFKKDTSAQSRNFKKLMEQQNLLVNETYSRRTWQKPARLQEVIIATRLSGIKRPITSLVTDVLPFHAYNDFINFNGKDYKSPLSKGLFQFFNFTLSEEVLSGTDTLWVINYLPKKNQADLRGTLYIHSDGYAISNLKAHSTDPGTKREIGIEQQYRKIDSLWFPHQLNYTLTLQMSVNNSTIYMKGVSSIDSVSFQPLEKFKFDRAHTTKLLPTAHLTKDTTWQNIRPVNLEPKEARTFLVMDSLTKNKGFDKLLQVGEKLVESKLPVNKFDINLDRIYSYNNYENSRIGLGLQTNEKISKRMSIGGWAGYGLGDKAWKYGAFAEYYADQYKEFIIRGSYYNDLKDPGRLQINKELDKNYLRMFLITRADKIEGWNASIEKKFGYLTATLSGRKENIQPLYSYQFNYKNAGFTSFNVLEANLNLRFAFGETTAPVFGKYYSTGTKYPVFYANVSRGVIRNLQLNFTQIVAAISWQKNINRFGKERFLLIGGTTTNGQTLPLSKSFAANGFLNDDRSVYVFGGMQTIRPYDYYMDKFINLYWMHEISQPLFNFKLTKLLSVSPKPAIGHNILLGTMSNPAVHKNVSFSVPDNAYHESGLMMNQLLRLRVFNFFYAGLTTGYFYHWTNELNSLNGKFVFGVNAEF